MLAPGFFATESVFHTLAHEAFHYHDFAKTLPEEQFDHVIRKAIEDRWSERFDLHLNNSRSADTASGRTSNLLGVEGAAEEFATWYVGETPTSTVLDTVRRGYEAPSRRGEDPQRRGEQDRIISEIFESIADGRAGARPGRDRVPVDSGEGLIVDTIFGIAAYYSADPSRPTDPTD